MQALARRATPAVMGAHPGRMTPDALAELRALNQAYRALLEHCTDDDLANAVRTRVADSQEWVGRACDERCRRAPRGCCSTMTPALARAAAGG
jgi:hypothetical protein